MAGVLFDKDSATRIAAVVKTVERGGPLQDGGGRSPTVTHIPFWALLGDEDPDNEGQYQWVMQLRANDTYKPMDTTVEGVTQDTVKYSAREANYTSGLSSTYVLCTFDGFDVDHVTPIYVFASTALPVPQYPGMALMCVAQDTLGGIFPFAHGFTAGTGTGG